MTKKNLTIISLAGCLYTTSCTNDTTILWGKGQSKIASNQSEKSEKPNRKVGEKEEKEKKQAPKPDPVVKIEESIIEPEDTPEHFLCPITCEVLTDPVIASDGHTYERKAIEDWFTKSNASPNTGLSLPNKDLLPNHVVKGMIEAFKSEQNKSILAIKKVKEINHKFFHESIKCFRSFEDLAEEQKVTLNTKLENAGTIWNKQTDENRYAMLNSNELLNISYEFLKLEFKQYLSATTQTARHALAAKYNHVSTEKFWYENHEMHAEWIQGVKNSF